MRTKINKYRQIEEEIIADIKSGKLKPGDKVDSESVLKKKYNVSTITVRKAFTDLINDGYLYGVQGLGTFVAKKQMIRGLTSISFSEELIQLGYEVDMIIDSIEEVENSVASEKLGLDPHATLVCIKRVRIANKEPMAYHISYFDPEVLSCEQAQSLYETRSLYKTLAQIGIYPEWVNENYSVKDINEPNVLNQMNVKKGTPSFFIKRVTFDEKDKVIEYAETYFNRDNYSVTVNIKV